MSTTLLLPAMAPTSPSCSDDDDELLSVGSESPPPQPPPSDENDSKSSSSVTASSRALKFSIDNILKPTFGHVPDPESRKDVPRPIDLSKSLSPGPSSASSPGSPAPSLKSSSAATPLQSAKDGQMLWPAWVYCTRYSDRPSSGKHTWPFWINQNRGNSMLGRSRPQNTIRTIIHVRYSEIKFSEETVNKLTFFLFFFLNKKIIIYLYLFLLIECLYTYIGNYYFHESYRLDNKSNTKLVKISCLNFPKISQIF